MTMITHLIQNALFSASLLLFSCSSQAQTLPADSVYHLEAGLTTASNQPLAWSALRGRPQLVSMIYTNCHMMCPLIIENAKHLYKQLTPTQRERLDVAMLSLDPQRDTPAALAATARRHHTPVSWKFLQPDAGAVRAIAHVLEIGYRFREDGSINHDSVLVLLDADGRILMRSVVEGAQAAPALVAKVQALLDHASSDGM